MSYAIKPAEDSILRVMYTFPYITGKQVTTLLYSPGSYKEVLAKLKRLFDHRYIERQPLPSQIQAGSVPYVYYLSAQGRHYVASLGYDFTGWRQPYEMKLVHSAHLWHALSVNEFLIAAANLAQSHPSLRLADIRHDLVLAHQMQLPCRCDGWIDFRINEQEQQCIWLELDRGTEKVTVFKQKIDKLMTYAKGQYERDFGTPAITIACVSTVGEERATDMRSWVEQVLTSRNETHERDLFRVIALQPPFDPSVFVTPLWSVPFSTRKHRVIEM